MLSSASLSASANISGSEDYSITSDSGSFFEKILLKKPAIIKPI
jgi:hypothetical protein